MNALAQKAFLEEFDNQHVGLSKGALSMVLTVNRRLIGMSLPVETKEFETAKQGQVKGLGRSAVMKILKEHGVTRILSEEGGRTSRGNMEKMRAYLDGINLLHNSGQLNLQLAEGFWIECTKRYFDSTPFSFRLDPSKSLRSCLKNLFGQAIERQRKAAGTMYVGAMMQHLIGAKLQILVGANIESHGFSVSDAATNRSGDFQIGDVAIHVTTTPGEALLRKCAANLAVGLRPLIITTEDGIGGARAFAKQSAIEDRVDVIEVEQFLAANLYEHSGFMRDIRPQTVRQLIEEYNKIIFEAESDPSLRIDFEG